MKLAVDTSVIISVITNEKHKAQLIQITKGLDLVAPASLHYEIGDALSAMFKRNRIDLQQAKVALKAYQRIPLRLTDIDLNDAVELAERLDIYAYDAYVIGCAIKHNCSLLTLDDGLAGAARKIGVGVREEVL